MSISLPSLPALTERALFGICNALLDITSEVDQAYLDKYGLVANNAILADEKTANLTEDMVKTLTVAYTAGGAGQNTIRAAQWKLPAGSTTYVSCVGEDEFARVLEAEARKDGVDVHYMRDGSKPTGTCATLLTERGHYRSLVANLGAALSMHVDFITKQTSLLERASLFYITGFMMNVSIDTVLHIAEHAHFNNKVMALNLSAPFVSQFYGKELMAAYAYADIVFGNESELHHFAVLNGLTEASSEANMMAMARLPQTEGKLHGRIVVITHGAEPTLVSDGSTVLTFPTPVIPSEEIVDANGAGDAFVGGFLAAYLSGADLETCVNEGHALAGFILRTSGIVFPRRTD